MMVAGGSHLEDRIKYAFRWATSRKPDAEEVGILLRLYHDQLKEFRHHPERADDFLQMGKYSSLVNLDNIERAAYGIVANAILNLSESLQKN